MILAPLSSLSDFNVLEPDIESITIKDTMKDGLLLYLRLGYLANRGNVSQAFVLARAEKRLVEDNGFEDIFDSTDFGERVDFYSLHQVLTNHGPPSSVLLSTLSEFPTRRGMPGLFSLILVYPEQGIIVKYTTEMRIVGKNVEGCMQNAHIEMDLFPAGNADAFHQALTPTDWPFHIAYHKPIEEVTSLSIDDFYEKFRQQTDECLVTPASLWPTPER